VSDKILREIATADMISDGTLSLGDSSPPRAAHHSVACTPTAGPNPTGDGQLSPATLDQLHTLLLGSPAAEWSPAWRYQAIEFSREPATPYGLLQHHGGCCGVLAAVQAFFVRRLVSPTSGSAGADLSALPAGPLMRDQPLSKEQADVAEARGAALLDALCDILLLAAADGGSAECVANGAHGTVNIVICSKDSLPSRRGLASALACHSVPASRQAVLAFLEARALAFRKPGGSGVVLLVYSLLLTRGLNAVRLQMDSPTAPLIDHRGYCTQELVNLICTGQAVSNVFDGSRTLHATGGGGDSDAVTMRGLEARAPVGLLCLAESSGHCQVGEWYKRPVWPVWLCCMESHYSVVFSPSGAPPPDEQTQASAPFQLVYYDQLGHMDEHILLTVHPAEHPGADGPHGLVPPLDETLRTRWPAARVDWGRTDPLL
jgi:hypothetical protein